MPEDQKSSFSEAVETGTSAAHTICGAIKTGKAISSAAKGAAAGGPYGAAAGAVWAGRKHIGKIIVAVIALLMLPVLFVLMLPGLIFGGLTNAFSPSDPEIPILNSETAIIENANEITFTLNGILGEALDDVLARIEADFAASGADHMEVKNAYSGGPIYNANLFISQYCAAKDKDFESISLNDLAATLRENKQHLYSYTSKQEIRESTVTDPETGEETTVSETWMVYTVRYNGESYFSDVVFQLTDDQKELASDYASNLSLFLGDGLLQNLEAWTGNSITALGDVTFTDGITPVVYYNQLDERYAGKAYGTDNIGGYGCGPTAMAIVVSSLTDDMVDPVEMAEWSYNNGYYNVFHIDQCDGLTPRFNQPAEPTPIPAADEIIDHYSQREHIKIHHQLGDEAYYSPSRDCIVLPLVEQFRSMGEFYSTAFHEITHSTGHRTRLNRLKATAHFGNAEYSKEELTAEIGAAALLNYAGIETKGTFRNNAAYIQSWLTVLKNDKRMVVAASSAAAKAVDYILG